MQLYDTHRSVAQRLRLSTNPQIGAGNYFWHVCRVADDLDEPLLSHLASPHPGSVSTTLPIDTYSLRSIRATVIRYARWYLGRGFGPASRIGVTTEDGLASLLHHIAITSVGAVTVLVNPQMPADIAADYFRRTSIDALVGDAERLAEIHTYAPGPPVVASTADLDKESWVNVSDVPAGLYYHSHDDLILISHSSGTTGIPKPTLFTHQGFFVGKRDRLWQFPSDRDDRMLTALPQSHSAGLSYLSLALMLGNQSDPPLICGVSMLASGL
jgi:3-aminoavenalumate diazotase